MGSDELRPRYLRHDGATFVVNPQFQSLECTRILCYVRVLACCLSIEAMSKRRLN
jgi:hypothetical protein